MTEFPSTYNPKEAEEKYYEFWLAHGLFTPNMTQEKKPYTVMIPLPNVTGRLTLGHVLNNSVQDILIRYKKLSGYETLWMVGMDHAGIATQVVVEEKLLERGIKKEDLGRERFVQEVWKWKEEYATVIRAQLKRMGCALDWSREQFTLSDDYSKKVIKVFVDLYHKDLIYRGEYIINWCPRCLSALSDEQVETVKQSGKLYYIKYPVVSSNDFVTVATTRPETMLGDTAVCVNPEDKRYRRLVGKKVLLPLMKREIPVITDEYVDPEFGTGALKVTPSHDPFDFELAKKHGLEFINIMNPDATLNENVKEFSGLERYEARKKVLEALKKEKLLDKIESYELPLATCERCHTAIEPRISKQWFVRMQPLAGPALKVVKKGHVRLYPKRWTNLYNHWLENVRDWCISRQLWWGHRIPVYYCRKCFDPDDAEFKKGVIVSEQKPKQCPDCGSTELSQDEDVLDTWFSSWLWPFATLGWPEDTDDFRRFYPTQTLVTGWDIIYLWVARMIMAGIEFTGTIPFSDVVFHPMIRDEKGRKMSKSLGNSPDPMDLIDTYGADALRFGIQLITPREQDVLFSEKSIDVGRKFCNKLWNASRLIWMKHRDVPDMLPDTLTPYDNWVLNEYNKLLDSIEKHYDNYELNAIARELYDFIWHTFCDWYLEIIKITSAQNIAKYLLRQILILLHPFIPFISEELYQRFSFAKKSILLETWPQKVVIQQRVADSESMKKLIEEIRNVRGLFNISSKEKVSVIIKANHDFEHFINTHADIMKKLAGVEQITFNEEPGTPVASVILPHVECFVTLPGIDFEREKNRLKKEIDALTMRIQEIKGRLRNTQYLNKASNDVKAREQQRLDEFLRKKGGIERAIERL